MLKSKILNYKSYIFYTFFKYLEYGILAFIFMSFANLVSPEEYGQASLGFQVITYSAFIVLGVNQVLLKRYSLEENKDLKTFYLQYNVFYNTLACFISILLVLALFSSKSYVFYLSMICGFKLILESSVAINRVTGKMKNINIIYLSYSILFLAFFFLFVSNVIDFFKFWSYAVVFGAFIGSLLSIYSILTIFDLKQFITNLQAHFKLLFNDGFKLALIALISPLFSTLNIIFLNAFKINNEVIGNFQLADNIANVVSLGGASILFIIFPDVIKQISKDKSRIKVFYRNGLKLIALCIFSLILFYYPLNKLLLYFFPDYQELSYLILFTLISRLLVLLLFIPNSVWITFSREDVYIKASVVAVFFLGIIFFAFLMYADVKSIYSYFLIFQIVVLILLHIYFRREIYQSVL